MEEILTKQRVLPVPKRNLTQELFRKLLEARQLSRHKLLQEQAIRAANARADARRQSEDEDDYGSDDANEIEADQDGYARDDALHNGAVPMDIDVCEGPVISFGYESASEREGVQGRAEREGVLGRVGLSAQRGTTEIVGPAEPSAEELAKSAETERAAAEAAEAAALAEREARAAAEAQER
jgi:hypothetical protein